MSEMFVWLHIIFNANTNSINRHKGKRPTTSATAYTASVHFYTPNNDPYICVQWMTCDVVARHCTYTHTGRCRDAVQSAAGPLTPPRPRFSLSPLHFFFSSFFKFTYLYACIRREQIISTSTYSLHATNGRSTYFSPHNPARRVYLLSLRIKIFSNRINWLNNARSFAKLNCLEYHPIWQ